MKYLYVLIFLSILISCNKQAQENKESLVGDYVYIDANDALHVRNNCISLRHVTNEFTGNTDMSVERIPIEECTRNMLQSTCSRCVTDSIYEHLLKTIEKQ